MLDEENLPVILPRELSDEGYLDQAEGEIRGYGRIVASGIAAIGKKLVEVKERVGHGKYTRFVVERLKFNERTARDFVSSYTLFKTANFADLESLQIAASAILLLARSTTPEEVIRISGDFWTRV